MNDEETFPPVSGSAIEKEVWKSDVCSDLWSGLSRSIGVSETCTTRKGNLMERDEVVGKILSRVHKRDVPSEWTLKGVVTFDIMYGGLVVVLGDDLILTSFHSRHRLIDK